MEIDDTKKGYSMLTLLQFCAAILVVLLHSDRVFNDEVFHFIQKSIFSRVAVPLFIISSAFFLRMKTSANPDYYKKYLKNYTRQYLLWSVIFIPYGYYYLQSMNLSTALIPLAVVFGFLYIGTCYHLWYMPAFLVGLFISNKLLRFLSLKKALIIAFVLYLIGCIETYFTYFQQTFIGDIYTSYRTFFFTTRNGLFYMPVFILLGFLLYDLRNTAFFKVKLKRKLVFSFGLMIFEGIFIFSSQGIDKNFLIALIPFSVFLFNWAIRTRAFEDKNWSYLKKLSGLYFFIHPIFLELIRPFSLGAGEQIGIHEGWVKFIFTIICTHLLAVTILFFQKKYALRQAAHAK